MESKIYIAMTRALSLLPVSLTLHPVSPSHPLSLSFLSVPMSLSPLSLSLPPPLSPLLSPPLSLPLSQIPGILEFPPAREFLSLDDPRATVPIYDRESLDEDGGDASTPGTYMDLGSTEKESAQITDFKLLKVIGKGSFGKVSGCSTCVSLCIEYMYMCWSMYRVHVHVLVYV